MNAYLKVPYEQRFAAKGAGAHWDREVKKWYTISRPEFMRCKKWWPNPLPADLIAWLNDPELNKYYGHVRTPEPKSDPLPKDRMRRRIISLSPIAKLRRERSIKAKEEFLRRHTQPE